MSTLSAIFGSPREWAIDLAIATGIGAFLGVIGPFGSFNGGPIGTRIAFWVINVWLGWTVISIMVRVLMHAALRFDLPEWFTLAVGVALAAVPLTLITHIVAVGFWGPDHVANSPFLDWYAQVLAIAEPVAFGSRFLQRRQLTRPNRSAPPLAVPLSNPPQDRNGTGFLDRLPPHLGRNLLCLQMEDHYVRVHTELGSDLVLTPLKDAMVELEHLEGAQVHRSWWVARHAVAKAAVKGRNYTLQLHNGLEVPVSRASVAKIRALGWLDTAS